MIAKGTADIIIGFEPGETVRMLPYLKENGQIIVSQRAIMPVTASLTDTPYDGEQMIGYLRKHISKLLVVDTEQACREIGSSKAINILLLGAAIHSGALGLEEDEIKEALRERLPERFHELNFRALAYVREHS